MKKLLLTLALLAAVVTAYGQGRVNFSNAGQLITTNNLGNSGSMATNVGVYYFGLYVGTAGTPSNALVLNILATNVQSLGRLSGGNPAFLQAPHADGSTYPLAFQIRGWSSGGGAYLSYEAANAAALSGVVGLLGGFSVLGSVVPTFAPAPNVPGLFGTSAGQVQGFELVPLVPEPSSIALGLLGLGAIALFRRRK